MYCKIKCYLCSKDHKTNFEFIINFSHLGVKCVGVNLHPHLNLQNNAKNWKGYFATMTINVEKEVIVLHLGNTNKKVHNKILTKIDQMKIHNSFYIQLPTIQP